MFNFSLRWLIIGIAIYALSYGLSYVTKTINHEAALIQQNQVKASN